MARTDLTKNTINKQEDAITGEQGNRISRGKATGISILAGLGAGLAGSLVAVLLMGLLRVFAGVPTPVELFGDFTLKHISVFTFLQLLSAFNPNSKSGPLGLALLAMIVLGILLGLVYAGLVRLKLPVQGYRPARREWLIAAGFAVVMAGLGIVLFWNELPQNFLGLPLDTATFVSAISLLADFTFYALMLCLSFRALLPHTFAQSVPAVVQGRRKLLARASVAAVSVGAGVASLGVLREYLDNFTSYDGKKYYPPGNVTAPITPNEDHYVVTQNPVDPSVNPGLWRLEVTGLVSNAGKYTLDEMKQLPSVSRAVTLECIANGVQDHLISTAIWQGITLRSLLERHGGAKPEATYVAFHSVDGYTISLPLKEVLEADALLAWSMNGVDLPKRHGYPMRVLIPGRYGEENPKWLTRVELTDHFVGGLYSDQGWYNGPLHIMSRIDRPRGAVAIGQSVEIGGIAFAGYKGIQKVEVSVDNGATWNEATLAAPLSQDAWRLWTWQWTPITRGQVTILARATDGTGEVQTSRKQGTVPSGATGYPEVTVQVR